MKKDLVCMTFGAIVLCFFAYHNKFPLLTPHSGIYIQEGFGHSLFQETASLYGLFIAHSSWGMSIWIVVFCQAFLLSIILFYCFKYFFDGPSREVVYLSFLLFAAFMLSASYVASTISPAVFTSITIMGVALLLLAPPMENGPLYLVLSNVVIGCCMDTANLLFVLFVAIAFWIRYLWGRIKHESKARPIQPKGARLMTLASLISVLALLLAFVVKNDMNISSVREKMTLSFFWHPVQEEYQPGNLKDISGLRILEIPHPLVPTVDSESFKAIHKWFNWETRNYFLSRQYQNWLSLDYLNYFQLVLIPLLLLMNIFLLVKYPPGSPLIVYLIAAIIVQGLISKGLHGRTNGAGMQTIWLISVPVFLHIKRFIVIIHSRYRIKI